MVQSICAEGPSRVLPHGTDVVHFGAPTAIEDMGNTVHTPRAYVFEYTDTFRFLSCGSNRPASPIREQLAYPLTSF